MYKPSLSGAAGWVEKQFNLPSLYLLWYHKQYELSTVHNLCCLAHYVLHINHTSICIPCCLKTSLYLRDHPHSGYPKRLPRREGTSRWKGASNTPSSVCSPCGLFASHTCCLRQAPLSLNRALYSLGRNKWGDCQPSWPNTGLLLLQRTGQKKGDPEANNGWLDGGGGRGG